MTLTAEFDSIGKDEWNSLLSNFNDATIFQTWDYAATRWGEQSLSHATFRQGNEIVALAQVIVARFPILGRSLAILNFGPVVQRRNCIIGVEKFIDILQMLYDEYVSRRRLFFRVRIWPYDIQESHRVIINRSTDWSLAHTVSSTYIMDISAREHDLRAAMDKKWRSNLRKSEQKELRLTQCEPQDGMQIFAGLHNEMTERKQFGSDFMKGLSEMCKHIPSQFRPVFFVCWNGTEPVAAAVVSAIGNKAFYLNGATGNAGLQVRGGYFLQWEIVRWLKERTECHWYDLYGAMSSPGVRQFKKGLVGAKACEIDIPEFEACEAPLVSVVVRNGVKLYKSYRSSFLRTKSAIKAFR